MNMRPTITMLTAVLALPTASTLAGQSGQFVVRLGRDTLAIEAYTRTADRLRGEQVVRTPRTVHRIYTVMFDPGGAAERYELVTHNVSGAPGPAETKATATFQGDSAVATVPRRDSTRTVRSRVGAGALPHLGQSLGTLSPPDSVRARVAGTSIAVWYSRPSMRGRVIFGNVVPWNQVWRTGANQATIFETGADLVVAGTTVPAGKYSLWTLPSQSGWKLIVHTNTRPWGAEYDTPDDLARLDLKVGAPPQPVGAVPITIEP